MSKMTPNPLRELARLRAQTETEPGHDYEFVAAALDITPDQWEAIAAVVEVARLIRNELEMQRNVGAHPNTVAMWHSTLATSLAALDAATSQEVAGEAK